VFFDLVVQLDPQEVNASLLFPRKSKGLKHSPPFNKQLLYDDLANLENKQTSIELK
jgi:hypothetical protein